LRSRPLTARLCSRNEGKLRELRAALPGWEIELLDADSYPPETGDTYYENALAKADFGRACELGVWVIGEDSGIEVAGLGGRPGVHSARFGGDDPVGRLLAELDGVADRRARYVCELVALDPDGAEHRGTGTLEGRIVDEPRGSEGFGYDPIFVPDGEERTVAELGNDWKRTSSHRARAAAALLGALSATRAPPAAPRRGRRSAAP
jgi:XTP/dITP diphosphohydrolase